jgi:O-antigen ligase
LDNVNGQAGFLLLGLWPCVALAESDNPGRAALGAASAALLGCLLVLTQSRGVVLATLASVALVLALVPGRRRRVWALLVIGGAVAAAAPVLSDVYASVQGRRAAPPESTVRDAGLVCLVAAFGASAAWAVAGAAVASLSARGPGSAARLRRAGDWALGALAAIAVIGAVAESGRISDRVSAQYHSFVRLDARPAETSRYLSGAGNRYDYWRIALREFRDEPVRGVGAGNYDVGYFLQRRTLEDVRQPHSLLLQTLAELGLVGALLLAIPLAAAAVGLARLARAARRERWARALAVAAGGTLIAWTVHTDVDWLHLIPGVTAVALASLAVVLRPWEGGNPSRGSRARTPALVALAVAVGAAAVLVARPVWSEHRRTQAREVLAADPTRAIARADDALSFNPDSVPAYYVKAAALARLGDYARARSTLLQATQREPRDFVTWGLLGDLALRHGDRAQAARYYGRAARLSPRDPALAAQLRRVRRPG